MPVLSIFCRFASRVTGGSSVSVSVSLSAVSSCTCVGRRACCARGSASRFRLPPRLWSTVRRVLVIKRVILGCDVTLCLHLFAPDVSSVLARFFRCPRCHCLVIASQCLVACLSSRICRCCCLLLSSVFGVSVSSLAVAGLVSCVGRAFPSVSVHGLRCGSATVSPFFLSTASMSSCRSMSRDWKVTPSWPCPTILVSSLSNAILVFNLSTWYV